MDTLKTSKKARTWALGVPVVLIALLGDVTANVEAATGRGGGTASASSASSGSGRGVTVERQFRFGSGANDQTTEHWFTEDAQDVSVMIHDGEITVHVNGEEIPVERLREEEGSIVILGADGRPIERIGVTNSPFGHTFRVGGDVKTPTVMLGVHLDEPGPALEHHLGLQPETCTMITALYEGLPAHAAGLREFDIITQIDGKTPARPQDVNQALDGRTPDDVVRLNVIHEGKPRVVEVTLAAYDAAAMAAAPVTGAAVQLDLMFDTQGGRGFSWTPQFEGMLVAPDRGGVFERLDPNRQLPPGRSWRGQTSEERRDETMERLDRLDRRLDELDAMLERLLERAEGSR